MAKDRFALFMDAIHKIEIMHRNEIEGNLRDYFYFKGMSGIPLGWENKPLSDDIKMKVDKAALRYLG